MSDDEKNVNLSSNSTNSDEPKIDPDKVIIIPPQMINESLEIPESRPNISDEDIEKPNQEDIE